MEYSNDIPYSSTTYCYYLPRRIPFQPMNYKDALNVSINDKLTKAKLIDIANTLQNELLANEIDAAQMNSAIQAQIIPFSNYIKDVQSRMNIHHVETRALVKDVVNLGRNTRKVLVTAMNNMD